MWLGKKNFDGNFMQDSTAFQAIFYTSIYTQIDVEKIVRPNILTFDRRNNNTNAPSIENPHAFSYWGIFSRMVIIYQAEFWVTTTIIILFFYLVLGLYAKVAEIGTILFKFQTAFKTGDFSTITPEE